MHSKFYCMDICINYEENKMLKFYLVISGLFLLVCIFKYIWKWISIGLLLIKEIYE
jgi:hypothetical protein